MSYVEIIATKKISYKFLQATNNNEVPVSDFTLQGVSPFSKQFSYFKCSRLFSQSKSPLELSQFSSLAFVKDAKGISFKNRLKGHINW
jgi:hypothetical protein